MTTLEKEVCGLEFAKKLKELGVKQESLCYWWPNGNLVIYNAAAEDEEPMGDSAFTVAELGEMLPARIDDYELDFGKYSDHWQYCYRDENKKVIFQSMHPKLEVAVADTEADARAKMLIYLLENKLI